MTYFVKKESTDNLATNNKNKELSGWLNVLHGHLIDGTLYTSHCCIDPNATPPCAQLKCISPVEEYLGDEEICQEICDRGTESLIAEGALLGNCAQIPNGFDEC
jgi:hypothetical protein